MSGILRRLLSTGLAYQVADLAAKVIALATLPVYTRVLTRADYGYAETLLTVVILVSIVARLGLGEALVRLHFLDGDPARRKDLARSATGALLVTTTVIAAAMIVAAGPLSEAVLGERRPDLLRATAIGVWAFTNLELAYALLRVEERTRAYAAASLANVGLTVSLTLWLVVGADQGALGLVLGNYAASAAVLLGLWWVLRDQLGFRVGGVRRAHLSSMLRFGLPTVPAEVSVFLLFFVDRLWLLRADSPEAAGEYSLAVKLAAGVVFTVRAFQYAWPPLAYSISDDEQAGRVYARITTLYVAFTGLVVAALTLFGRWVVRLFAGPEFYDAHLALPWVGLGWALYGLFLVLVAMAGRAQVTVRNFPAALAGLAANVVLLALLIEPLGPAGAGIALCGAYVVMLLVMYALTRRLFPVPFEWRRLALVVAVCGGMTVAADLLLPTAGVGGLILRVLVFCAIPAVLAALRFLRPDEVDGLRALGARLARRGVGGPAAGDDAVVPPGPPGTATS